MRTAGIAGLLAVVAACAPLGGAEAPDQARLILEVRISHLRIANRPMSESAVLEHLRIRPGDIYDTKVIEKGKKRLLGTNRFDSVVIHGQPTPRGVVVTCVLEERDVVAKIAFRGNKAFKASELLKSLVFSVGGAVDPFAVGVGRDTLRRKYRNAGYYFADVFADKQALSTRQQVIYTVVEGPKVTVRSINLEGITYLGYWQRLALTTFQLRASSRAWWSKIPGGTLKDEDLEHDIDVIRTRYEDDGFLDVKVSRKLEFSADKTDAHLTYLVRENARHYVNKILFDGNVIFSEMELTRRIGLKRGAVVTAEALKLDVDKLIATYGQFGYVDAKVDISKRYLQPGSALPEWTGRLDDKYEKALMNISFTIGEGEQWRVGRIDVRSSPSYKYGDKVTQRRIVLREMTLLPGQLFSTTAAKRSEAEIMMTRIFSKVTVKPIEPNKPAKPNKPRAPAEPNALIPIVEPNGPKPWKEFNIRDALVETAEGKAGDAMFTIALSSDTGIGVGVSLRHRNFDVEAVPTSWRDLTWRELLFGPVWKGAGQTIQVSASPGTRFSRLSLGWREPSLNDRPYSLNTKLFAVTGLRESYDENRVGVNLGVGHRFKNGWAAGVSSRTTTVQIADIEDDAPPQVLNLKGQTFIQGIETSLERNRTDNRWAPSAGDVTRFSFEQVVGDFTFEKVTAEYRVYQTLGVDSFDRKHILSGKVWAGQIIGYAPTFERFYGGGIGSIRGFEYRGISPRSGRHDEPIGGDFIAYAGGEYSYPLAGEHLRGVVFLDSGTVHQDVQFDTWRMSTGFGIRLTVPQLMGSVPISLDFGFPLIKNRQDDTSLVSFTMGWTF